MDLHPPQPFRNRIWYGDLFPTQGIDQPPYGRHIPPPPPPPPLHRLPNPFPPHPPSMHPFQETRHPISPRFNFSPQRHHMIGSQFYETDHTRPGSQSLRGRLLLPMALSPRENAKLRGFQEGFQPSYFSAGDSDFRHLSQRDYDERRRVPVSDWPFNLSVDRHIDENRFRKVYGLGPFLHDDRGGIYEGDYDDRSRIFFNDCNLDLFTERRLDRSMCRRVSVGSPNFYQHRGFDKGGWASSSNGPFPLLYNSMDEGDRRWLVGDRGRGRFSLNERPYAGLQYGGMSHLDREICVDKHWSSDTLSSSLNVQDHRLCIGRDHRDRKWNHRVKQRSFPNMESKNGKRVYSHKPKGSAKGELKCQRDKELLIRPSKRRRMKNVDASSVSQYRKDFHSDREGATLGQKEKEECLRIESEGMHDKERVNGSVDCTIPFMSNAIIAEDDLYPSLSDVKGDRDLKNESKNTMADLSTKKASNDVLKSNLTHEVVPQSGATGNGSGLCENPNTNDLGSPGLTCLRKKRRFREQPFHEKTSHSRNDPRTVVNFNESIDDPSAVHGLNLKGRRGPGDAEVASFNSACMQSDSHGRQGRPLNIAEGYDSASILKAVDVGGLVQVEPSVDTDQSTALRVNERFENCPGNTLSNGMRNYRVDDLIKDSSNYELVNLESFTVEEAPKIISSLNDHDVSSFGGDGGNKDSAKHELAPLENFTIEEASKIISCLDDHNDASFPRINGNDAPEVLQGNLPSSCSVAGRLLHQKPENAVTSGIECPDSEDILRTCETVPQGVVDLKGMKNLGGPLSDSLSLQGCSGDENATELEKETSLYPKNSLARPKFPWHQVLKSRKWHRNSSHAGVIVPTLPLSSTENIHSIYMRKGNSLVRKPLLSTDASSSIHRSVSRVTGNKDIQPYDCKIHGVDTSALPGFLNSQSVCPILATNRPGGQTFKISKEGATTTSRIPKSNSFDNSNCPNVLQDENFGKEMRYVKRKRNQLVAVPIFSGKSSSMDKSKATVPQGYFKNKENQLVRKISDPHAKKRDTVINPTEVLARATLTRPSTKRIIALSKAIKYSNFSFVWNLHDKKSQSKHQRVVATQKFLPQILPWKKRTYWRSCKRAVYMMENSASLPSTSKKSILSRKRGTVYTRSSHGYSLRMSRVPNVSKSTLKCTNSTEKNSEDATEENASAIIASEERRKGEVTATSLSSSIPRERTFLIGSERYKMDPSRRTLQRITAEQVSSSSDIHSQNNVPCVPRRFLLGCEKYVRIGKGNQLVRDPKKRSRVLASEKIRWSLYTARLRLARKRKYCQFFTRFGKCNKDGGKCPYMHDPSKIAVCTKFLSGSCSNPDCKLTHKVIPERMQDCSYFLKGSCSNDNCPYRHVNVDPNSPVCESFLRGYCDGGNECPKKHTYVCPAFEDTGTCPRASTCKLHHPKKKAEKTTLGDTNAARGRYFDSGLIDAAAAAAAYTFMEKPSSTGKVDVAFHDGKFPDYISLDVSDAEEDENSSPTIPNDQTPDLGMDS